MAEKVIIIGGTAAGLSAASKAKRVAPSLEITVFERSGYISYGACGLPYFVGGIIDQPDDLVSLNVDQMTNQRGVPTFIHHEVTSIDRTAQTVTVRDLDSGKSWQQPYDKLVIATGAHAIVPDIPGADAEGVYTLRTVEDGIRLKSTVHGGEHKAIAIVGGGFIGLEAAVALSDMWGVKVSVVEMMDQMLPGVLSHNMGKMAAHDCEAHGLSVYTSEKVVKLEGKDGAVCKVITDKRELPAQLVIFAAGFLPNGQLAKDAGLEVAPFGAIVVNEKMQTSDPDIYAGGDCVAIKNLITGKLGYLPLGNYCVTGQTSTGTQTTVGRTLAVNPYVIPYGTEVWLYLEDGTLAGDFIAEDTGSNMLANPNVIDIYMGQDSYNDCILWGAQNVEVYIRATAESETAQ